MNLLLAILLIIVAFFGGMLAGMYLVRKQIENNPRLNIDAVRTMLSANGQKPNEAKVQQVYRQIKNQQKAALENAKKKK